MIPVWHILKIRSNDASYIQQELSLFGIKTYYPMLKHSTDPSKWRHKPLFNGYMFIQIIDLEESSSILNRVKGIIDFLRTDGMPAEISDDFMDQLQNKVNAKKYAKGTRRTLSGVVRIKTVRVAPAPARTPSFRTVMATNICENAKTVAYKMACS